jgi:hypothetical protein
VSSESWGHADRYYAASIEALHAVDRGGEHAGSRWGKALEQASPGIRSAVERTYKQWNTILRDYLRTETALRLAVGGDSQSVPVKVVDGMPRRFVEVMGQFEGLEWLLLNRPAVTAAASGTRFMEVQVDSVRAAWGDTAGPSDMNDIRRVRQTAETWLAKLDEIRAVEQIIGIDEDVLGAYFFRIPEIRLYWVVIGITARALGVSPDALTIVVLAHELAHAYTHLGRDIDNERWETERFAKSDIEIVEGLAQFYTQILCMRLEHRMPAALEAYQALLKKQSGPYTAHLKWVEFDERGGEIIRISMIECRSRGITASSNFSEAIKRYRLGVRGRTQEVTSG